MLKIFSLFLILLIILAASGLAYIFFWPLPGKQQAEEVQFKIKWGTSFEKIAANLEEKEIIQSKERFKIATKLLKKAHSFKAGLFTLHKNSSNYQAIRALISGPQSFIQVTIPEGTELIKIASVLQSKIETDSLKIVQLATDSSFVKKLGISAPTLEGYLYPETYSFTYGLQEEQVVRTMVNQFNKLYSDSLRRQSAVIGLNTNEVVTLASIIEGEAMLDSEMPLISSVYHNRLKKGMLLQADPTIQYILKDAPRRLLTRDLAIDSPYNTYKHQGLPPGPINNPSIAAIKAALYPADTSYLYFVARGDGGHVFSATLNQHLNAKRNFDKIRRQVAREKRRNE